MYIKPCLSLKQMLYYVNKQDVIQLKDLNAQTS